MTTGDKDYFHLFAYDNYGAGGGMGDYIDSFGTIEAAKERTNTYCRDFYDIAIQKNGKLETVETGSSYYELGNMCIRWEKV